jgi:hypothetical protein
VKPFWLILWIVIGAVAGLAAGIVFVMACAATTGAGIEDPPGWRRTLSALCWVPLVLGLGLGITSAILLWRRKQNRGGPPSPPGAEQ